MTTAPIKAIETPYAGFRFRSRAEARWAVVFDHIRLPWSYEPEGYVLPGGVKYLPDFWLPSVSMWAEVKGKPPNEYEIRKAWELVKASGFPLLLLVGNPDLCAYWALDPEGWPLKIDRKTTVRICDYVIDGSYLDENRFYANTGSGVDTFPRPNNTFTDVDPAPVMAARSARFEHGESGAPGVYPGAYAVQCVQPALRELVGTCERCGYLLYEYADECPECAAPLEWCKSCCKQITEENAEVRSEDGCESCAVYPCGWCGKELPTDDEELLSIDAIGGCLAEGDSPRICAKCLWEDRNP